MFKVKELHIKYITLISSNDYNVRTYSRGNLSSSSIGICLPNSGSAMKVVTAFPQDIKVRLDQTLNIFPID